jgi:hypothetical protein
MRMAAILVREVIQSAVAGMVPRNGIAEAFENESDRLRRLALLCGLRNHPPVTNVVGHRFAAPGLDGALKPHDGLIYPIITARRIDLGIFTTDGRLGDALVALIHLAAGHLGSSQASVMALSMRCR